MTEVTTEAVLKKAEEAMQAVHAFKSDLLPKLNKLDGFDQKKLEDIAKSAADAIELSQKQAGQIAAQEAERKAMAEQIDTLKTVISRPGFGGSVDEKQALAEKSNKLFNQFARTKYSNSEDVIEFANRTGVDQAELKALSVNSDPNGG